MNRRNFLQLLTIGSMTVMADQLIPGSKTNPATDKSGSDQRKFWAWIATDTNPSEDEWKRRFAEMRAAGITAVLPQVYQGRHAFFASKHLPVKEHWLEKLLPLAKAEGLEFHAWIWMMPCNIPEINEKHPEWFVVNGKGESAVEKPAYVGYYKFMCPSRPEVHAFVQKTLNELGQYSEIDGIHFDYIRYPDVILPDTLQPNYNIVQDREYPEYDYCYCDVCREAFKAQTGIDPFTLADPSENDAWRQFRYDRVTTMVNEKFIPVVRKHGKMATAAVFPNWEHVRQQWSRWHLDAVLPMLYHGFYNGDIDWIEKYTRKGVNSLPENIPLYSGLFVPHISPEAVSEALGAARSGGAKGISIFRAASMTADHWAALQKAIGQFK